MENGAGAITEAHFAEVKTVDEGIIGSKVEDRVVASLHETKDSEGDEIFEEAIEGNIDDVNPVSKPLVDGCLTGTSANAVFAEGSGRSALPVVDQISGVRHVVEVVEDTTGVGYDAGIHEKQNLDKGHNSSMMNNVVDLLVANVNDKGGTSTDEVPTTGEKMIKEDKKFFSIDDSGAIKEVVTEKLKVVDNGKDENDDMELLDVFEREALKHDQHIHEGSVQVTFVKDVAEIRDADKMEPDHSIAYQISETDGLPQQDEEVYDLKGAGVTGSGGLDEANSEARSTLAGISSQEQSNESKKGAVAGGREEDTVEFQDASAGSIVEGQESSHIRQGDGSHKTGKVAWDDETRKEPGDQITLLSDKQEGSLELNGCSVMDAPFENSESQVPNNEKSGTVTTAMGIENSDSDQIRLADTDDDTCNHSMVEHVTEEKVDIDKQNSQASREMEIEHVPDGSSYSGASFVNCSSSAMDASFETSESHVSDNEKSDTVTVPLGTETNDSNQMRHADSLVEGPMKNEKVAKEKQKSQASRGMQIKLVPAGSSSSGTSSNPALPPTRPAGLGHGAPLLEPTPRVVQQPRANRTSSQVQAQLAEGSANGESEDGDETREKLQMIRVKFLRLAHRLGQTPHNDVVAQVLYRLGLAEQLRGRNGARTGNFSFDRASSMAEQLEATGQEPLDFSCTIMVLGKTGVGKSATINSIFDEVKFSTDAFQLGTKKVQDVVGTVQGIKVRVIDTPGLLPSWSDQCQNIKILHSVKRFIKKSPPDIILYLDRLDMQSRDLGDMPLLRTIRDIFGPSIWFNAIVVLTHAATAPPEGPNGVSSSYEMLVTQRSHVVQNAIRQAAGDMRLMNPVALVENHSACRTNRAGQRILPNGQVWKPRLLLLSFASKILAEANTHLKLQDSPSGKPFPTQSRVPPLPFLLSSLLQSRPQLKLPEEQFGDGDDALDDELDDSSDSDDDSEYDELPPFKPLTNAQLAQLAKHQRKAYHDELEYREKLFMKKQLKEEKKRNKMMKKMAAAARDMPSDYGENAEESGTAASVPVPMPDLALPASFDADNPTHRYRCLDSSNQWLVRPVLDSHGWDHDVGYEGINAERLFVVKNKIPMSVSGQVSKDKKEANVQMEVSSSMKHGEGKATTVGFDMQSAGKDMAYTLRSETRFSNYRHNKVTAGLSATLLGDTMSAGLKVEDKLIVNKRFRVVMSGGAMTSRADVAYGGSLEASLRDKDYPLGRFLSTLGLSVMDWHGDLAIGCNVQSQIPVGRSTNLIARGSLNNKGSGQVSIRLNSSEQIQIALIGLIPFIQKIFGQPQQQLPYGH